MEDLQLAKRAIVSLVQRQSFSEELEDLKKEDKTSGQCVKKSSSIVKFKPMLCEHGLLRVSGRISEAPSTFDSKHQMILPQNHHVTTLIIRFYHQQLGHCGQEQLLSRLREEFWIIKGRATIKRVIGKCIPCRKRYAVRMTLYGLNIRGNVKQLRSDNGSNFVGAERELREALEGWNQNRIEGHLRQSGVDWIFHPPYASHMSGETNSWRQAIIES